MSKNNLENIKKLRELTGVGFSDCKTAIDENNGNIDKAVEYLRKKGIAKANKKSSREAKEGAIGVYSNEYFTTIIQVNTETDFAAKNDQFIKFAEELSQLTLDKSGNMNDILISNMENKKSVKDNLISLISKIGEKITFRRCDFIGSDKSVNFSYTHSSLKKNVGKIGVLLSLKTKKKKTELLDLGKKLTMHIAALSPLSIDKENLDPKVLEKEKEIITEQLKNTGKDPKIIDKIAIGKLNKFISDNTLLNQEWIMDPKKKVRDIIKEADSKDKIEIIKYVRFKVGEGI